jgi:hypothetical protein
MVLIAFADIRPAPSSGKAIVVKDGSIEATIGKTLFGVATRTRPAPARRAARPAKAAAPLIPILPAMIKTLPKSPLWASAARGFNLGIVSTNCIQTRSTVGYPTWYPIVRYITKNAGYGQ